MATVTDTASDGTGRVALLLKWAAGLLAVYAAAWVLSRATVWFAARGVGRDIQPLGSTSFAAFAGGFAAFFLPLLYLGCCALARQWLRPHLPTLVLYVGTTFFCAVWAEVGADTLFVAALGRTAWKYHVWPLHHGYTSLVGLVMWPMYGFFVCLLHQAIHVNPRLAFLDGDLQRAVLVGVDAMVLEVAANAFSLIGFGSYFFHYTLSDLAHFTTAEIFLPYVLAGYLGLFLLGKLARGAHPVAWGLVLHVAALASLAWLAT